MEALIINGREPITEQQMYEMYEVNKDFRETDRITHNNWTTTIKTKEGDIAQTLNHQTKLSLKPKYGSMIPEWSVEIMENLLKNQGIERPKLEKNTMKESDYLGGLMLTDLHLNQTDIKNQSFNQRVNSVNQRISRVMDKLLRFEPSSLLIPNLGDMNNSDVKHLTSSLKTPMQDNLAMKESYKRLLEREIKLLESMQQYGIPVKYIKMSGNHDEFTAYQGGIALQYYFGDSLEVVVPDNRHYEIWGKTMIALSHGDRGEGNKLFQMVVDECITKQKKQLDYLYAYLGHHHKKIIHQEGPLEIKNLQAPGLKTERCDKFGHDMKQSMTGYIWGKNEGQVVEVRG